MKTVDQKALRPEERKSPLKPGGVLAPISLTKGNCLAIVAVIALCIPALQCNTGSSPKFDQYYVQGQKLYEKNCSNCHQKDGSGLGRVYPPLNTSDYMNENFNEVLCLMRHGKSGPIIVNGQQYNQPMKGISNLSDLEIAEIATYIYNTWSHQRGIVEVREASEILNACAGTKN